MRAVNPKCRHRRHVSSLTLVLILQRVKLPFPRMSPLGCRSHRDAGGMSMKRWSKNGETEHLTGAVCVPSSKSQLISAPFLWGSSSSLNFLHSGIKVRTALFPNPSKPRVGLGLGQRSQGLLTHLKIEFHGWEQKQQ